VYPRGGQIGFRSGYNPSVSEVTSAQSDAWTTRRLLDWIGVHLDQKGVHNPTLVGRMLLTHVIGGTDIDLYTDPDRPASADELDRLRPLVAKAASHEPVQYLVGQADFFGRAFRVSPATLIPRTATESLVQIVLDWYRGIPVESRDSASLTIADIGTGSGCIGLTLARQIPGARVIATDIVEEAIQLARTNAALQGLEDRVEFRLGSLLSPLESDSCDVICANLPYVPDADWEGLEANVKDHEPETALRGGIDGLDLLRPVIAGSRERLKPGGLLVLEIDPAQASKVLEQVESHQGFSEASIERDEFKDDRILRAVATPLEP